MKIHRNREYLYFYVKIQPTRMPFIYVISELWFSDVTDFFHEREVRIPLNKWLFACESEHSVFHSRDHR